MRELILFKGEESEVMSERRDMFFQKFSLEREPDYQYGLNIIIEPESFDVKDLSLQEGIIDRKMTYEGVGVYSGNSFPDEISVFFDGWDPIIPDKYWYYNQAAANDVVIIRIPKGVHVEKPIQVTDIVQSKQVVSHVYVIAEPGSKARILFMRSGGEEYVGEEVRIHAETGSEIDFVSIQNFDENVTFVSRRIAHAHKDAKVRCSDVILGGGYTRLSVESDLLYDGAETEITVLYLGSHDQRIDVSTVARHVGKHTLSNIVTRGVVNGSSQALSRGLVQIQKNALGSSGYEKQDALIMSEKAEADAIPNLEIHNHDVTCSHGSTVGQVDMEMVYYLMTRGLTEEKAKLLIVEGYFTPIISDFSDEIKSTVRDAIYSSIEVEE